MVNAFRLVPIILNQLV